MTPAAMGWRAWALDDGQLVSPHTRTPWNGHTITVEADPTPADRNQPGIYAWPDLTTARFSIATQPVIGRVQIDNPTRTTDLATYADEDGNLLVEALPELRGTSCAIRYLLVDDTAPPVTLADRYQVPVYRYTRHDGMLARLLDACATVTRIGNPADVDEARALLAALQRSGAHQ